MGPDRRADQTYPGTRAQNPRHWLGGTEELLLNRSPNHSDGYRLWATQSFALQCKKPKSSASQNKPHYKGLIGTAWLPMGFILPSSPNEHPSLVQNSGGGGGGLPTSPRNREFSTNPPLIQDDGSASNFIHWGNAARIPPKRGYGACACPWPNNLLRGYLEWRRKGGAGSGRELLPHPLPECTPTHPMWTAWLGPVGCSDLGGNHSVWDRPARCLLQTVVQAGRAATRRFAHGWCQNLNQGAESCALSSQRWGWRGPFLDKEPAGLDFRGAHRLSMPVGETGWWFTGMNWFEFLESFAVWNFGGGMDA